MERISVLICAANVAEMIEATCHSVSWADELVFIDSGSSDATGEIARRYADRYVVEPWRGYTGQKIFGAELCRNDWIFRIDGDEECSKELADAICALSAADLDRSDLFLVARRDYLMGRKVRDLSPDWLTRLYNRKRCQWADEALHDRLIATSSARVGKLRGVIYHKRQSKAGFRDYLDGAAIDARLELVAADMYSKGRRAHFTDLCFRPLFTFLKFYLLKGNFMDGSFGLMVAQRAAIGTQRKYAALWARADGSRATPSPSPTAEGQVPAARTEPRNIS
jgi:(heptosyl)LPS beta-1,4-glucosyltransferase